jgi:hypothetical protein
MYKPEEIVANLRPVDMLVSQGASMADAVRQPTRLVYGPKMALRNRRCSV